MVLHSSSASLSSFPFSIAASSSSSSSLSSPPSSPASSHDSFPAPAFSSSSPSSTPALVPFLWEEKPGVLKKAMQISEGRDHERDGRPSDRFHPPTVHAHAHARAHRADSCAPASKRTSRALPGSRSKVRSESVPHLRPPPCLSQPNLHVYEQDKNDGAHSDHHQLQLGASVGVKSKAMSSFPFHKRRHHRAITLEDDPFWMAMVACTNDEGKGSCMQVNGSRDKAYADMQRTNSWFARRVQGHSIRFEQCMPRHASNGGKSQASSHCRSSDSEEIRDAANKGDRQDSANTSTQSMHHASKAFKALNDAKSELQSRCKVLLQQQSAPVDISCTTRHYKKPGFASKRKLPDLFGCKTHHPLSSIPP